jgi:hypothetical protein
VSPAPDTLVMLARRPHAPALVAFGHVDVAPAGRRQLHEIVTELARFVTAKEPVSFHPDDLAADDEILVSPLKGFDAWFQDQALWSLERAVREIRAAGSPATLTSAGIVQGKWSFYVVRSTVDAKDVIIVRAKAPSWGLSGQNRLLTKVVGDELKLVDEPLIAFDRTADLVVVDQQVHVVDPRASERLLIDADAVKDRAEQTAAAFRGKLRATLSPKTLTAVERVCSNNANVARRVERLTRDTELSRVTAAKVRAALKDAGLPTNAFGSSGPLKAVSDRDATILVDIAADLYYQPRFADAPRRVAAYRKVR